MDADRDAMAITCLMELVTFDQRFRPNLGFGLLLRFLVEAEV